MTRQAADRAGGYACCRSRTGAAPARPLSDSTRRVMAYATTPGRRAVPTPLGYSHDRRDPAAEAVAADEGIRTALPTRPAGRCGPGSQAAGVGRAFPAGRRRGTALQPAAVQGAGGGAGGLRRLRRADDRLAAAALA